MSQSPTDPAKATMSTLPSTSATRRSPSPRTSLTSPPSTVTPSAGILRISNKPRRASGSSVEFRVPPEQQLQTEPASPQPSVDRLSVSFAADTPGGGGSGSTPGGSGSGSVAQTSPVAATPTGLLRSGCIMGVSGTGRGQRPPPLTLNGTDFKTRLAADTSDLGEEDEDYSASLSAIIQRRASTRRHSRRRRPSSPFSPGATAGGVAGGVAAAAAAGTPTAAPGAAGMVPTPSATPATRRRSSVFTTSSAETGGSGDTDSQEQIMENLKLHKEVLWGVKQQPWGMRRKLKLVRQAKTYVKRHEGQLQQRRATRDVLARFNLFLLKKWQRFKREFANLLNYLLPWEARIKEIESHFGSVVASYFTFLRWLCWVNLVTTVVTIVFIVVPEVLTDDFKTAGERKEMLPEEKVNGTNLLTLWDFNGILKYSPIFYGYYRNGTGAMEGRTGYRIPFAYFMTGIALYVYSFVAILRKMAANSRMSKLSEKDDECVFTWKLFTGWDYMIGNAETAHNKVASTILGFKEALLEEAEKQREQRNWRIIAARIFVNISVFILLVTSAYAVVFTVGRSAENDPNADFWRRNETTVIINIVNFLFPLLFELLGLLERYHPRKTLRLQLARIMILNLLNLFSFIFSTFTKIHGMTEEIKVYEKIHLNRFNPNLTAISCPCKGSSSFTTIATLTTTLALATTSLMNPTSVGPNTSLPSTWHPTTPPTSTFSSLISIGFPPPPSTSTKSTSSISTKFTLPSPVTPPFPLSTQPGSNSTQLIPPTLNSTESTPPIPTSSTSALTSEESTRWLLEVSDFNSTFDYSNGLATQQTDKDSVGVLDQSLDVNSSDRANFTLNRADSASSLEQLLPVNKYDANEDFNEAETKSTPQTVPTEPVAVFLGEKYRRKRSVSKDIDPEGATSTDYDYYTEPTGLTERASSTPGDISTTDVTGDESTSSDTSDLISDTSPSPDFTTNPSSTATPPSTTVLPSSVTTVPSSIIMTTSRFTPSPSTSTTPPHTTSTAINLNSTIFSIDLTNVTSAISPNSTNNKTNSEDSVNGSAIQIASAVTPELICFAEQCEGAEKYNFKRVSSIDLNLRRNLSNLCWETMFGQELVKMTVMDLVMTILSTLSVDFFRAVFVRLMNNCWCWDLEKKFPQYGDFKIAENVLHLVNNQGMVWMGMFFSPGLALINLVKLAIILYLRSWAVLTCNVPHEVVFRASRSNNFYLALLLTMLFLCVLPVGYALVRLTPSWHCGPLSGYNPAYTILTKSMFALIPESLKDGLGYVASPGIVIPLLLLLSLVIYYLLSLTNSLREANNDLKIQLRRERTEERRRMFQLVERRRRGASGSTDLADKWKKLLPALPSTRDEESTVDQPSGGTRPDNAARRKELLTRLLRHALRKSSATSDDESGVGAVDPDADGDGTDAEQPDSLPEDAPAKPTTKSGRSSISQTVDALRRIRRQPQTPTQPPAPPQPPQVMSPTASSHREREDSVASAWSDTNIPVIRISKTESTDCVVDVDQDEKNPTGSSDTVVARDDLADDEKRRRNAMGRAIIREARRRRDSARDEPAKDDAGKGEKDDLTGVTPS